MERLNSIDDLRRLRERLSSEIFLPDRFRARVCCGTACTASGSAKVISKMEESASKKGIDLEIVKTGCQGMCQKGPVMNIEPAGIFYQRVKAEQAPSLIDSRSLEVCPSGRPSSGRI